MYSYKSERPAAAYSFQQCSLSLSAQSSTSFLSLSLSSFKFSPDSGLKSGFSALNQTYGMLL